MNHYKDNDLSEEKHLTLNENEIYVIQSPFIKTKARYWSEKKKDWFPLMEASILIRYITRYWGKTITFDQALKEEGYIEDNKSNSS